MAPILAGYEINRVHNFHGFNQHQEAFPQGVLRQDMEQKYRIYGKVLLKNAGYTRITRTTCPSLPRFYKILWTRWMDGWMFSNTRSRAERKEIWPAIPPALSFPLLQDKGWRKEIVSSLSLPLFKWNRLNFDWKIFCENFSLV